MERQWYHATIERLKAERRLSQLDELLKEVRNLSCDLNANCPLVFKAKSLETRILHQRDVLFEEMILSKQEEEILSKRYELRGGYYE